MDAPLAQFDEDWHDFNEFTAAFDDNLDRINSNVSEPRPEDYFSPDLQSPVCGEIQSFNSVEDLVHNFEQKLALCFQNYSNTTEEIAPVQAITEEKLLQRDEIWNTLTENFGKVMPVDWKSSHTRSLHLPSLNLQQQALEDGNLDLSDDEELREQMDLHSIIVSCANEEPLLTAEQVISEIEEIMQESTGDDQENNTSPSDLSILSKELHTPSHAMSTSSSKERLRRMNIRELEVQLEEVEKKIREFSEELIEQLALRDELDFEKEVKNSFISLLIDVQNRQKEMLKRKRRSRNTISSTQRGEHAPGTRFTVEGLSSVIQKSLNSPIGGSGRETQYLTTVIPYEKRSGSPSVEDLQILTKILYAMRDDSEKVPSLLTDYILKVLCPT